MTSCSPSPRSQWPDRSGFAPDFLLTHRWCFRGHWKPRYSIVGFSLPAAGDLRQGETKKQNRLGSSSNHVLFKYQPYIRRIISFFSPKNPILYLAGRSSDSASTPQTPSRFSPVTFVCSSTSQQRSCRRFALRSLFTCTLRTSTCKLPIFCFRGYYSTPFADLQYKIDILMVLPRRILYQILRREPKNGGYFEGIRFVFIHLDLL
jgi:hypothetical protein